MKKYIILSLCAFWLVSQGAYAQNVPDDEKVDTTTINNNPKNNKKNSKPVKLDKLFIGSDLGFSFVRALSIEMHPYIGVRVADIIALAGGFSYMYSYNLYTQRSTSIYGGRVFARIRPLGATNSGWRNFYIHAEGQYLNLDYPNPSYNPQSPNSGIPQYIRRSAPSVNVGAGTTTNFGKGFGMTFDFLINVLYFQGGSLFSSPLIIRWGFSYGF